MRGVTIAWICDVTQWCRQSIHIGARLVCGHIWQCLVRLTLGQRRQRGWPHCISGDIQRRSCSHVTSHVPITHICSCTAIGPLTSLLSLSCPLNTPLWSSHCFHDNESDIDTCASGGPADGDTRPRHRHRDYTGCRPHHSPSLGADISPQHCHGAAQHRIPGTPLDCPPAAVCHTPHSGHGPSTADAANDGAEQRM